MLSQLPIIFHVIMSLQQVNPSDTSFAEECADMILVYCLICYLIGT